MKQFRLNRLFNAKSGRCFDVAIDHGFFNEHGFGLGLNNEHVASWTNNLKLWLNYLNKK